MKFCNFFSQLCKWVPAVHALSMAHHEVPQALEVDLRARRASTRYYGTIILEVFQAQDAVSILTSSRYFDNVEVRLGQCRRD